MNRTRMDTAKNTQVKLDRVNLTRAKIALFIVMYCRKDVSEASFFLYK